MRVVAELEIRLPESLLKRGKKLTSLGWKQQPSSDCLSPPPSSSETCGRSCINPERELVRTFYGHLLTHSVSSSNLLFYSTREHRRSNRRTPNRVKKTNKPRNKKCTSNPTTSRFQSESARVSPRPIALWALGAATAAEELQSTSNPPPLPLTLLAIAQK